MLLHEDGRLVLSDFGLAHLIKQGRLEAGSSASWGTPYYMAPEQIRGEPELRSDLYALGVILYQLLTNQRPFTGTTPEAVMMKHLLEAPPPLRAVLPEAPAMLESVMQKALEKQPKDRYPTAEALLANFRAIVSSLLSEAIQQPSPARSNMTPIPQRVSVASAPQKTKKQWIDEGLAFFYTVSRCNDALFAFEQALRIDPNDAVACFGKGCALWDLRCYEEARIIYEQAFLLVPRDAPGFYLKGCALYYLQRYSEALATFEQALYLDPMYASAWIGKGCALADLQRQQEGLEACERAIQLDPNFARAWDCKAYVLGEQKRYQEALIACGRAIQLDPTSACSLLRKEWVLGELRRNMGWGY